MKKQKKKINGVISRISSKSVGCFSQRFFCLKKHFFSKKYCPIEIKNRFARKEVPVLGNVFIYKKFKRNNLIVFDFNLKKIFWRLKKLWIISRESVLCKAISAISILAIISGMCFQFLPNNVQGATYVWDQDSWEGGADGGTYPNHTDNRTNWTKYSSKDSDIEAGTNVKLLADGGGSYPLVSTGTSSIDFATEEDYIQEDGSGTNFGSEKVMLENLAGSSWTTGSMTSSPWPSVTYGNGTFVAVSSYGQRVATSSNGTAWTLRSTSSIDAAWSSVVYGNGTFVAVANTVYSSGAITNIAATSSDGITWTQRTLPASKNWISVTYGNGVFLATSYNSTVAATSPDGITWTQRAMLSTNDWYATYGNGTFAAVSYYGSGSNKAATSSNGASWTLRTLPASAGWRSIAYGNETFVAIAYNSSIAATSPDGITWAQRALPVSANWISIAYGNGVFVAIAYNSNIAATSPDGITWTQRTLPSSKYWQSTAYGNGIFTAVGENGCNAATTGGYPTTPYYVTTSDSSQIDTSTLEHITGATITQTTPANTSVKYLISFDDRSTWKYWDGNSWESSSLGNLQTDGMAYSVIENLSQANWESTGGFIPGTGTLDFAMDLSTTDSTVTPEIDNIAVNYENLQDALISSSFNAEDSDAVILEIKWSENLPADTDIKFQLRTSPDNSTWTEWQGPSGMGSYFTDSNGETMLEEFADGVDDQYFMYKVYLSTSDSGVTPTLSDVQVSYSNVSSASDSNISVSPSPVSAGNPATITVTAYDSSGNPHTEGGDTVVIDITGSNSATPSVTDNGDGTYTATYTPTTVGTDQITATINSTAVGEDSDGTSDGTFNLTISAVPASDPTEEDEEEEAEEENRSTLTESEDGTLTLDNNVSKGETEVEHISPEDDQGTQIKEIQLEADNNHKINGEIEIKEVKKTEVPELPEELSGYSCSVYTQIKVDADSSISKEDVDSVTFQFRISKKYKKSNPDPNFFVTREKGGEVILLEQKSNQANEITATSSWIKGTWTVLDCSEKVAQPENPENEIKKTTPAAPVSASAPEAPESSDVQNSDSGDSSKVVITLDGDFDGSDDFLLDTDGDSRPDTYWDPDSGIFSRIEMKDIDNDSVEEYVLGEATYYDPSDKKVKLIKPSLKEQAQEILNENKVVAAGIVTTGAALPFLALPFQLNSLSDIGLLLKETFFRILGFLGWSKRKRRDWGIVYDVDSGFPIPLATIQVIDKISGKVKETRLTDSLGSYCFLVSPGTYVLASEKKEFSEFKDGDLSALPVYYENTYRYQPLEFKDYAKINADIPMQAMPGSSIEKLQKKSVWKSLIKAIFWLGFLVNVIVFAIDPNLLNGIFVLAYLGLEVMQNFGSKGPKWGTVTDAEGVLQSFVTLKLYRAENRELVARTITDEKGRYFLIANPGDYVLTAETIGGKETEVSFSLKARSSVKEKIGV